MDLKNSFGIGIAILALVVSGFAISSDNNNSKELDRSSKELNRIVNSLTEVVSGEQFGGNTSYQRQSFVEGFWGGTGRQLSVSRTGLFTSSSDMVLTTEANATSSLRVGEIETFATSSATIICLNFLAIATTSADGHVTWSYGNCP